MNLEKPNENLELSPEMRIRGCNTLEELYYVLRAMKQIEGSQQTHSAESVIGFIQQAEEEKGRGAAEVDVYLKFVTKNLGIREKARKLILGDLD